jgi:glycine/D-amino acid oxidase-like deaminating enzyme
MLNQRFPDGKHPDPRLCFPLASPAAIRWIGDQIMVSTSENDSGAAMPEVRRVLVLGGGSAGLLAALTLKILHPSLDVQMVRSSEIGVIGVGEGTTAVLPAHFNCLPTWPGLLGIDNWMAALLGLGVPFRHHPEIPASGKKAWESQCQQRRELAKQAVHAELCIGAARRAARPEPRVTLS